MGFKGLYPKFKLHADRCRCFTISARSPSTSRLVAASVRIFPQDSSFTAARQASAGRHAHCADPGDPSTRYPRQIPPPGWRATGRSLSLSCSSTSCYGEHASHDNFVDLNAKGVSGLLGDADTKPNFGISTAALPPTLFLADCIINIAEFEFSTGTVRQDKDAGASSYGLGSEPR